jgi:hypothetical protein
VLLCKLPQGASADRLGSLLHVNRHDHERGPNEHAAMARSVEVDIELVGFGMTYAAMRLVVHATLPFAVATCGTCRLPGQAPMLEVQGVELQCQGHARPQECRDKA